MRSIAAVLLGVMTGALTGATALDQDSSVRRSSRRRPVAHDDRTDSGALLAPRNEAAISAWSHPDANEICSPGVLPAGDFVALTYNVAGLPEGLSGSHPATNTQLISPLLNGYDLVLVQESWQTPRRNPLAPLRVYHELLVAQARHPYRSIAAPLPFGFDRRRRSAIVSDGLNFLSRWPVGDVVRVPWDSCHMSSADCFALKGFSVARMDLAEGATVDVYNLHMEAGHHAEDDVLRERAVRQLAAFIAAYSAGRAVIVGGDFNLHGNKLPDALTLRLLEHLGQLTDACSALACGDPARVDKFLFRSGASVRLTPVAWRNEAARFTDARGRPLSDHDPVAVRFGWSASANACTATLAAVEK